MQMCAVVPANLTSEYLLCARGSIFPLPFLLHPVQFTFKKG